MGRLTMGELTSSALPVAEMVQAVRRTAEALQGASALPVGRVKVPVGGGKAFEFPGLNPEEPEYVNRFTGVVLHAAFQNARWDRAFGESSDKAPACMSRDGLTGTDAAGVAHDCRACPWNRLGSRADGRGKACRNLAQMLVMVEDEPLPVALRLPTMSVGNWARYVAQVLSPRGLMPWQVATTFSLMRAVSGGGAEYSQVVFQCAGRVRDDDILPLLGSLTPLIE